MFRNNKKLVTEYNQGFTLAELLTTMTIFSLIVISVVAIYIGALKIQRRAFHVQTIQENALSVLESMAKEIRVSRIEDQNNNCSTDPPATQLTIIHPSEGTVVYRLNSISGIVERVVGGVIYYLSSQDALFNTLRFCVIGSTTPSDNQPARITIITSVSNRIGQEILTVNLQTTITSRDVASEL